MAGGSERLAVDTGALDADTWTGPRSAMRSLVGNIKMIIFCTKTRIQFQAYGIIPQPATADSLCSDVVFMFLLKKNKTMPKDQLHVGGHWLLLGAVLHSWAVVSH